MVLNHMTDDSWTISNPIEQQIKQKIEAKGIPLKNWDIKINYGIKTGFNKAFIIDGKKKDELIAQDPKSAEILKPMLRGRDIKRYKAEFADLWLIYVPWHFPLHKNAEVKGVSVKAENEFKYQFPAVFNHLLNHKEKLSARNKAETGIHYEWYALQRWAADYYHQFEREKIVYNDICSNLTFAIAEKNIFFNNTVYFISSDNPLEYILSLLNSKLIDWYYKKISVQLGEKAVRMFSIYVEKIPMPQISFNDQKIFSKLTERILKAKTADPTADTTALENRIDELVYKLYDFTYDEVKVIDPEFGLRKEEYEIFKIDN